MNKKKEKSPYATLKIDKVVAPNKPKNEPRATRKNTGGDMRVK